MCACVYVCVSNSIHSVRDVVSGVVWEETIILLPPEIKLVFLSATLSNARDFADWICHLKRRPCHVVSTNFRPTPLQHYVFPTGGSGLYQVLDERAVFKTDNFQSALATLQKDNADRLTANSSDRGPMMGGSGHGSSRDNRGGGASNNRQDCLRLIGALKERNWHPVIVFCFSRRECESQALHTSKLMLNDEDESKLVDEVFSNAIAALADEDRNLPQVVNILPLLRRGIAVHHSGLLPILREVIEILFQESLVKVLFATETFAMGTIHITHLRIDVHCLLLWDCKCSLIYLSGCLFWCATLGINMPARTVVFTNLQKVRTMLTIFWTGKYVVVLSLYAFGAVPMFVLPCSLMGSNSDFFLRASIFK